jgi:glycosyltransferase involved in cell wall biosynthesis
MQSEIPISVIIPVYNGASYLHEAIDSMLNQTFKRFELILLNDGSTDSSWEIIQDYAAKDSRIVSVNQRQNQGLPMTLNNGIEIARGKYIARMDQDDISVPERLRLQYVYLEEHPEIALLGGGYAPFNEAGQRLEIFHPSESMMIAWKMISNSYFCHPTVMFRKQVIDRVGVYPATGAEDFAFFSRIVSIFPCANLPVILIHYREHGTNLSKTGKTRIAESVAETFRENFIHYMGNSERLTVYHVFHSEKRLGLRDLFFICGANHRILEAIRQTSGKKFLSLAYLRLRWGVFIFTVGALTKTLLTRIFSLMHL